MAEHDDEREASRLYHQLPREEPPAALDAKIRAEARAAAQTHPAPLVPPTGRRQWYFPVAAAAVIVLAVAVTWRIEREPPDAEIATAPQAKEQGPEPKPMVRQELPRDRLARNDIAREAKPAPAPAAPAPETPERRMQAESASGALSSAPEPRARAFAKQMLSPEAELERIAALRRQGRHDEADTALAEFRKRHPDYRIAPEMLRKVERK